MMRVSGVYKKSRVLPKGAVAAPGKFSCNSNLSLSAATLSDYFEQVII